MSEEIDWKSRAEAAELLNEEYRIQLLMADKISGEQRSRAEAAEEEVEKWKSDWHKYKTRLERTDCRNAGEFYEMGGSHCPLDRPCDRCEWEREERRIQAEVARLTQQLDDLGHRYAGVESSLHGANARIAELEAEVARLTGQIEFLAGELETEREDMLERVLSNDIWLTFEGNDWVLVSAVRAALLGEDAK